MERIVREKSQDPNETVFLISKGKEKKRKMKHNGFFLYTSTILSLCITALYDEGGKVKCE